MVHRIAPMAVKILDYSERSRVLLHVVSRSIPWEIAVSIGAVVCVWLDFGVDCVGYRVVQYDCCELLGNSNKGELSKSSLCF